MIYRALLVAVLVVAVATGCKATGDDDTSASGHHHHTSSSCEQFDASRNFSEWEEDCG